MILLIDNYDSFSYNLYQLLGGMQPDIRVVRNDELTAAEIAALAPSHIILSPGPGRPKEAGVCEAVVQSLAGTIPILGVCLGHQAICEASGATITYARQLMHGKQSRVRVDGRCRLFRQLPEEVLVGRYHSLAVQADTLPSCLQATAWADDGEVMAVADEARRLYGLQFHPESIMTPEGAEMVRAFLE